MQGLEGTVRLHYHTLRLVMYDNESSVSIVVTTYFYEKNGPRWKRRT
jgi:hypothetical protein